MKKKVVFLLAAVNVQNRVVQAQAQLPAEVLRLGVAVEKQQPAQLRILALESPGGTYDENFLSNYFYNNLRPAILRIQGVGKCEVWGGQYALRIWLRPEAMARYGIVPSDITTLLEEQNVEASIGSIGENTSGTFYKQFGLTMAVAVGISLLYALTLAPALCAMILKMNDDNKKSLSQRVRHIYDASFHALLGRYTKVAMLPIRQKWLAVAGVTVALALTALLLRTVPTGFVPDEDMGSLMIDVSAPSGYTLAKTEEVMNRLTDQIQQLPEVESVGGVVGFGGANKGMVQVQLRPWNQRSGSDHTSWAVSTRINEILANEHEAESFAMSPGMIDGYGRGGGFELSVTNKNGQDLRTFFDVTEHFVEVLNRRPEVSDAYSGYAIDYPQYRVDVDVSRCKKLGVSPSTVLNEMGAFLGSSYVSNFNKYNQVYQVTMQLRPILMTSLTMIFGMLPLMFASGAGANGSRTVGVGTVGGMLIGTLGLLFVVPALFVIFQTLQERFKPVEFVESDDPLIVEEMRHIEAYRAAKADTKQNN